MCPHFVFVSFPPALAGWSHLLLWVLVSSSAPTTLSLLHVQSFIRNFLHTLNPKHRTLSVTLRQPTQENAVIASAKATMAPPAATAPPPAPAPPAGAPPAADAEANWG